MGTVGPDSPLTERSQLLEALVLTLEAADQLMATTVVERAMKLGWTVDDVRLHLITPAMHDVGLPWAREGELHSLGARIVAHVLSERAWAVPFLGAATPVAAWSQIVRARPRTSRW